MKVLLLQCSRNKDAVALPELERIWNKLHTFPHIFEVAAARGNHMDYDLNGQQKNTSNSIYRTRYVPSMDGAADRVRYAAAKRYARTKHV